MKRLPILVLIVFLSLYIFPPIVQAVSVPVSCSDSTNIDLDNSFNFVADGLCSNNDELTDEFPSEWKDGWSFVRILKIPYENIGTDNSHTQLNNVHILVDTNIDKDKMDSNGYDIVFENSEGEELSHDIDYINDMGGYYNVKAWVLFTDELWADEDETFYLYFDNPTIDTLGESKEDDITTWNVWDYKGVWHMNENGETDMYNPVSGGLSATVENNYSTLSAMQNNDTKIGKGYYFMTDLNTYTDNKDHIHVGKNSEFDFSDDLTISFWFYADYEAAVGVGGDGVDETDPDYHTWYWWYGNVFSTTGTLANTETVYGLSMYYAGFNIRSLLYWGNPVTPSNSMDAYNEETQEAHHGLWDHATALDREWRYVVFRKDQLGVDSSYADYIVDGVLIDTSDIFYTDIGGHSSSDIVFGKNIDPRENASSVLGSKVYGFKGYLDEIRMAEAFIPYHNVMTDYRSQNNNSDFSIQGAAETEFQYNSNIKVTQFQTTNILDGETITTGIISFLATANLPSGSAGRVQFSQDGVNWYNSDGTEGGYDFLVDGNNSIGLYSLGWDTDDFYTKFLLEYDESNPASVDSFEVKYDEGALLTDSSVTTTDGDTEAEVDETVTYTFAFSDPISTTQSTVNIGGYNGLTLSVVSGGCTLIGLTGSNCYTVDVPASGFGTQVVDLNAVGTDGVGIDYEEGDLAETVTSEVGALFRNVHEDVDVTQLIPNSSGNGTFGGGAYDIVVLDDSSLDGNPAPQPVFESTTMQIYNIYNNERTLSSFEVEFTEGKDNNWNDCYFVDSEPINGVVVTHYCTGDFTDMDGVIDDSYTMYIPYIAGQIGVRICPGVDTAEEVNKSCENGFFINYEAGETSENGVDITIGKDLLFPENQVWIVTGLTNTGGMGVFDTGVGFTLTPNNADAGEEVDVMMEYETNAIFDVGDQIQITWENDPGMTMDYCDTAITDADGDGTPDGNISIDAVDKILTYTFNAATTSFDIALCAKVSYSDQASYSVIMNDDNAVFGIALFHVDDNNLVNVIAHIEPTLSFNIRNWGDTADTNVCDLGVVSTQTQPDGEVDGFTSGECGYGLAVGTNAEDGFIVSVNSDRKLSNGVYEIADVGASFTAGTEAYGYYGFIGGEDRDDHNGTGDVLPGAFFDNLEDDPFEPKEVPDTEEIFALYTDPFVYTRDSGNADLTRVIHAMTVSPATPAGTYTHQVTYTVVANY